MWTKKSAFDLAAQAAAQLVGFLRGRFALFGATAGGFAVFVYRKEMLANPPFILAPIGRVYEVLLFRL